MTFPETLSPAPCEEDVKVACDLVGCRIARAHSGTAFAQADTVNYAYNAKSELTNAVAVADAAYTYAYDFDEIGNRRTSSECGVRSAEYASNELNQYTAISTDTSALFVSPRETFTPLFDADGNQTRVKTATGTWQVSYNGENRPILWTCGETNIVMSYDRMGRRVTKSAECGGQSAECCRFVYDGYLQIANHHSTSTPTPSPYTYFIWDPTDPVATRPLVWFNSALDTPHSALYYTHDGNKNVSEVIAQDGGIAAHYEYAPFGAVTVQSGDSAANPWRFSSEFSDDELGCDYYNYREYEPMTGRWMNRDPVKEDACINLFLFIRNQFCLHDALGLKDNSCSRVGVFNVTKISVNINPMDKEFDQKEAKAAAEDLLKRLAKLGFSSSTYGIGKPGRVLRLIYSGADYYSQKKAEFVNSDGLVQSLDEFSKKYLDNIFRIDGRMEFELCMCRNGKLRFVRQEDILESEDVDFENIYDFGLYKDAINSAIKSVERELIKRLGEKVKEAQGYEQEVH